MGKTILFSPVGGSDPMSEAYDRDGSLLHVARIYKPDIIYVYMSKEILEKELKDNRYTYCLKKLQELQNRKIQVETIKRPDLKYVHDFDYFYNDFESIIKDILNTMKGGDRLLFNISSGTPAMKSALLVWATLRASHDIQCIQVSTPNKGMNEHKHDDENYDVELRWELNEDNDEELFQNRAQEVECPNLLTIHNEEIIRQKVLDCDYRAAVAIALQQPEHRRNKYIRFLRAAEARLMLDFDRIDRIITKEEQKMLFGKLIGTGDFDYEYALSLFIKKEKHEYGDFVRALSPLIVDLFLKILENKIEFNLKNYTYIDSKGVEKWDYDLLKKTEYWDILKEGYPTFKGTFVSSAHLIKIINAKITDMEIIKTADSLRSIEEKVRNIAAHDLVSVSEYVIQQRTGYQSAEIIELLKKMFLFVNPSMDTSIWGSYDIMNNTVIDIIEE